MAATETNAPEPKSETAIEIRLNGQPTPIPEACTVAELLRSISKDPRTVAIERNGEIVRRAAFEQTRLQSGDVLELVQFVQGG